MHPVRSLLIGLAALLLAPPFVMAQAPAPAKDPIDAAIDVLWNTAKQDNLVVTFAMDLDKARKLLVEQREQSFKKVAALLDNNEVQVRLNAAIVLAQMAQAGGDAPELLQALKRCVGDSNPAMAQWGAQGIITSAQFPDAERLAALTSCLKTDRPRPLRVAVVLAASDAKLKPAIPPIIKYLEDLKEDYRKQVDAALTPQTEGGRIEIGPGGAAAMFPTEGGRAPTRFDDRASGRVSDRPAMAPPMARRPGPPGAETHAPTARPGATPLPGAPGQPAVSVTPKKALPPMDPTKLTLQEQEMVIRDLEELPTVMELHHIGLALEALVGSANPMQKVTFEFDSTPPWALSRCVDAASKWLATQPAGEFNPAPAVRPAPAAVPPAPAAAPAPKGS